ncbi:hypothetical protein ACFL4G_07885 [Thermodesulfobacteriota bacterium]
MKKEFDLSLNIDDVKILPDFGRIIDDEKLCRLHPHWFVNEPVTDKDRFTATIMDHATDESFTFSCSISFGGPSTDILKVTVLEGPFRSLRFFVRGSRLFAEVTYLTARPDEKTESDLFLWIKSIREYLRIYIIRNPATLFFRVLMNRVILTMNPSQRKICLMLFRFTLLEVLVIILIVVGYVMFAK